MNRYASKTRSASANTDQVICARPCVLYGFYPEVVTTGTITIADSATATGSNDIHIAAIGVLTAGKTFGPKGIKMDAGLTIKQSVAGDRTLYVWEAL